MAELTPYNRRQNSVSKRNDFWDVRSMLDDFFNDSFLPTFMGNRQYMKADVRENDKEYVVDVELPGVKKEDIKIDLKDDMLTIAVERNEEISEERSNYIRKERKYGSCSRSFYIDNIKHDEVSAKYNDGILTLTLPKQDASKTSSTKIDIH